LYISYSRMSRDTLDIIFLENGTLYYVILLQ